MPPPRLPPVEADEQGRRTYRWAEERLSKVTALAAANWKDPEVYLEEIKKSRSKDKPSSRTSRTHTKNSETQDELSSQTLFKPQDTQDLRLETVVGEGTAEVTKTTSERRPQHGPTLPEQTSSRIERRAGAALAAGSQDAWAAPRPALPALASAGLVMAQEPVVDLTAVVAAVQREAKMKELAPLLDMDLHQHDQRADSKKHQEIVAWVVPKDLSQAGRFVDEKQQRQMMVVEEKLPHGVRICILGSTRFFHPENEQLTQAIAQQLIDAPDGLAERVIVLTEGMGGAQDTFAHGLGEYFTEGRLFNLVHAGKESGYAVGEDIEAGDDLLEQVQLFAKVGHVYLCIEGGPGIAKQASIAQANGAIVLPVAQSGGASSGLFDFPASALKGPEWMDADQWKSLQIAQTPGETANAVLAVIASCVQRVRAAPGQGVLSRGATRHPVRPLRQKGKPGGEEKPGELRALLQALVASAKFELFFAFLIMANTVVMAAQVQYRGLDTGFKIKYHGLAHPVTAVWPGADTLFIVLEYLFGVAFTLEILLKLAALHVYFFLDPWNLLDLSVVAAWFVDTIGDGVLPIDPMLLRLVRLVKLMRMLRLVKTIQGFDALYILITSIRASISALAWTVLLMSAVMMMIAVFLATIVDGYINDETIERARREAVYEYYGSLHRAALTLFELTLANWPPAARVLTENVSELYIMFVLVFQATIGFSVVKVVTGVFFHVTMNVAANDDFIMLTRKERTLKKYTTALSLLFEAADEDGNGRLDSEEFAKMMDDPIVVDWLGSLGFEVGSFSPKEVYELLTTKECEDLSAGELITGVTKLQGPATSLNLAKVGKEVRETRDLMQRVFDELEELVSSMGLPSRKRSWQEAKKVEEKQESPSKSASEYRQKSAVSSALFGHNEGEEELPAGCAARLQYGLRRLVNHPNFEAVFASLIALNTVVMGAQVQYRGIETGHKLRYKGMDRPASEVWPFAEEVFFGIEVFFAIAFTFEIGAKCVALGLRFWKDAWNVLDALIMVAWYFEFVDFVVFPLDPMLLRLFRLVKLFRMIRLVKFLERQDQLYLMIASIKASFGALAWSSALLLVIQLMLALFMATLLESYLKSGEPLHNKQEVYKYYGTFTRALLTLFELSLGNFIPVTRLVATNVTEAYVVFALLHKFSVGFAVIMVITGIFVQETMSVAKTDNTIMLNLKKSGTRMHIKKMQSFFALADADGSGSLDAGEFEEVCADEQVKMWLAAQELDVSDAKTMHAMMCEETNSEEVTPEQLVKGMARLKGSARNLDMMSLRRENSELRTILKELLAKVEQIERVTSREREEDEEEKAAMSDIGE
eukprot:TRINITY_DN4765_c0_g1_i6.p1 TRINITY_DN4765_c0_g1~~TRINITY_DN4765_c0_g1_i6.p1  ORF type:complete len:1330 (+),score=261.30 TRINITY_DN4765_c0_g1_i6:119-4108(+)